MNYNEISGCIVMIVSCDVNVLLKMLAQAWLTYLGLVIIKSQTFRLLNEM